MDDNDKKPDAEDSTAETESAGQPEAGEKTFTQSEVNRIVEERLARERRKSEAKGEAKKTPAKGESPPSDIIAEFNTLKQEMAAMKAEAAFTTAVAGLDLTADQREALREVHGLKAFDVMLATLRATKSPAAPSKPQPKPTPGTTPAGPPQSDRDWDLRNATAEDIARYRADGSLRERGELMRRMLGGSPNIFSNKLRKRDK